MTELIRSLHITDSAYLNALISVVVFIALAWLVDIFVDKVLRRFAHFTKSDLDDRILDVVHRPLFYSVILVGLLVVVIDLNPSEKTLYILKGAIYSILTLLWSITIIRTGNTTIEHSVSTVQDTTGLSKDVVPLIENILLIVVIVGGAFLFLTIWNINVTPLLASAGIVGILVALAAKDTVGNFFGGISIFIDKPFKIGDYIVLDGKERGEVVMIGIRSTRIKTRDDILITIPNSIIANSKIVNESAPQPQFRIRIPIGVAYGSNIDLVQNTLLELALNNSNVVREPEPRVRFREFGESSLNFELLCWTHEPALRGLTVHELNCEIYKEFDRRGIRIPFPQRDVHLFNKGDG